MSTVLFFSSKPIFIEDFSWLSMPKRNCTFTKELENDYPFLKKLCGHNDRVKCQQCLSEFSIAHGGRADIKDHVKCSKHKASVSAIASSSTITSFFKNAEPAENELSIAAKEATFAFHTAMHDISFKTSDCSSKLISKLFEPKFGSARTKCEAIITGVIAPMATDELHNDLKECNFLSISTDTSNRHDVKLAPIVVRYFVPERGISVKLLDFQSVSGETSEILANHIMSILKKHEIENKVAAFCGDNCNTNFGGVNRRGTNNVYSRLKEGLGVNIKGIGCSAHIVHNTIQHGVDGLPVEIEAIVVKIYKYFCIYTVRVTNLKEFCETADIEYKKLVKHGNTRFLSLLPAVERILQLFEGLKSYFLAQVNCPLALRQFFTTEIGELYFWFVHGQLNVFNKTIESMEKTNSTATDVGMELAKLKTNLRNRMENKFLPQAAKRLLNKLKDSINVENFMNDVDAFYGRCISYLELWEKSFDGAEDFEWICLNNELNWSEIEKAAENINKMQKPQSQNPIMIDELFDEVSLAKGFLQNSNEASYSEKWVQLFTHFHKQHIEVPNFKKIVEFAMCLPGTSAPVERIFSQMKKMWSDDRGRMEECVVEALLTCKLNLNMSCTEFYDKIKHDKNFLKKVHSSEKYKANVGEL